MSNGAGGVLALLRASLTLSGIFESDPAHGSQVERLLGRHSTLEGHVDDLRHQVEARATQISIIAKHLIRTRSNASKRTGVLCLTNERVSPLLRRRGGSNETF